MRSIPSPSGFSSIFALLMTAFLLVIATGMLALVMREWSIGHSVYRGILSYAGAESAVEYGLLKVARHRDGFSDTVVSTDYDTDLTARNPADILRSRDVLITYTMRNSGNAYSGTVRAGAFEVIPLFVDRGTVFQSVSKTPVPTVPRTVEPTDTFTIQPTGGMLVWNLIGTDPMTHETLGIVGTGAANQNFGNDAIVVAPHNQGILKRLSHQEFLRDTVTISSFLTAYTDVYMILYNPSSTDISYTMASHKDFSFPVRSIVGSASIAGMTQNIEYTEDRSRLFDALKYSVFNR